MTRSGYTVTSVMATGYGHYINTFGGHICSANYSPERHRTSRLVNYSTATVAAAAAALGCPKRPTGEF